MTIRHQTKPSRRKPAAPRDVPIPALFQVVVQCRDEAEQREVYERLAGEGRKCRLLML